MKNIEQIINNPNLWHLLETMPVDWEKISKLQLPKEFIEKFKNKIKKESTTQYRPFSEEFIEKYKDKTDWELYAQYQRLSEEFMEKFSKKL